jgi:predicted nuclease with TOPRIM domain
MFDLHEHTLRLSGLVNESKIEEMENFAQKRHDGAKKIAESAKEKGGVALLTYNHFHVKLPYYEKAAKGNFDFMKKEYVKLCSELHSYMDKVENLDQTKFQKLVGKIEVLGELLIQNHKI